MTYHNQIVFSTVTDALLELHTQYSVLNPRPAELIHTTIQEHGLKFQEPSPVHSTWKSKLDPNNSVSCVSGDAISDLTRREDDNLACSLKTKTTGLY